MQLAPNTVVSPLCRCGGDGTLFENHVEEHTLDKVSRAESTVTPFFSRVFMPLKA